MECLTPVRVAVKDGVGAGSRRLVRCGKCISCRVTRRTIWTGRMLMESKLHPSSVFLTLTYNEESKPAGGVLMKKDLQHFLMRCRNEGVKLRYFSTGEYGKKSRRPHYHAILFGLGLRDAPFLTERWNNAKERGFVTVTEANKARFHYVAKYTLKDSRDTCPHDPETGEEVPEFQAMSLKPAIGAPFIDQVVLPQLKDKDFNMEDFAGGIRLDNRIWPIGQYLYNRLATGLGQKVDTSLGQHLKADHGWYLSVLNDELEIKRYEAQQKAKRNIERTSCHI